MPDLDDKEGGGGGIRDDELISQAEALADEAALIDDSVSARSCALKCLRTGDDYVRSLGVTILGKIGDYSDIRMLENLSIRGTGASFDMSLAGVLMEFPTQEGLSKIVDILSDHTKERVCRYAIANSLFGMLDHVDVTPIKEVYLGEPDPLIKLVLGGMLFTATGSKKYLDFVERQIDSEDEITSNEAKNMLEDLSQ